MFFKGYWNLSIKYYISAYKNLGRVDVKKGERIKAKQKIGKVFTNQKSRKSTMQFSIFNNAVPENPKNSIYEMWITLPETMPLLEEYI